MAALCASSLPLVSVCLASVVLRSGGCLVVPDLSLQQDHPPLSFGVLRWCWLLSSLVCLVCLAGGLASVVPLVLCGGSGCRLAVGLIASFGWRLPRACLRSSWLFRAGGCLAVVWVCGLVWWVSCLVASVLPLVCLRRSLRVVFAAVLIAFCVGGLAAYRVRVVCWSVVRLPLVCASGVLSGLHPPPFYLSVFGLGVPLWCACSVCLVCVSGLGVFLTSLHLHLHQTFAPAFDT